MKKKNLKVKLENIFRSERSTKEAPAAGAKPEYSLRLLFVIVEHGHSGEIVESLTKFGVKFHIICHGEGTADSALLELLNLDSSAKGVIISLVGTAKVADVLKEIYDSYEGNGVAFTIKLNSIGGMKALQLITGDLSALNINTEKTSGAKE